MKAAGRWAPTVTGRLDAGGMAQPDRWRSGEYLPAGWEKSTGGLIHSRERCKISPAGPIITGMPCVIKLIMDLILGPEEQIVYVSVTTR